MRAPAPHAWLRPGTLPAQMPSKAATSPGSRRAQLCVQVLDHQGRGQGPEPRGGGCAQAGCCASSPASAEHAALQDPLAIVGIVAIIAPFIFVLIGVQVRVLAGPSGWAPPEQRASGVACAGRLPGHEPLQPLRRLPACQCLSALRAWNSAARAAAAARAASGERQPAAAEGQEHGAVLQPRRASRLSGAGWSLSDRAGRMMHVSRGPVGRQHVQYTAGQVMAVQAASLQYRLARPACAASKCWSAVTGSSIACAG